MIVSVLTLGCDDSMIGEAFREVLSMLDEVCIAEVVYNLIHCLFNTCSVFAVETDRIHFFQFRPKLKPTLVFSDISCCCNSLQ